MTQLDFDTLPLFLSKQADHEIDFINDMVVGVVYLAICSEDNWVALDFKASVTKSYTAGELWRDGWGAHCVDTPTVEIDDIGNITVEYNDSSDIEILNIDYTSRIDEIKTLISDFIYDEELTTPFKHNAYNTYNV